MLVRSSGNCSNFFLGSDSELRLGGAFGSCLIGCEYSWEGCLGVGACRKESVQGSVCYRAGVAVLYSRLTLSWKAGHRPVTDPETKT